MAVRQTTSVVQVRLSPDAQALEVFLASKGPDLPPEALATLIVAQCTRLRIPSPPSVEQLTPLVRHCPRDAWITLLTSVDPGTPVDGSIELLVPIPVYTGQRGVQGRRNAVRTGTPLARRVPGSPGTLGRDLLGRAIPARAPREVRLPQGEQTVASDDGNLLRAACDGEVLLRNLLIEVVPMFVYDGDIGPGTSLVFDEPAVFVTGSIQERARLEVEGSVYVQGSVHEAQIRSRGDNITVMGAVSGSAQQPSELRAYGDVQCGPVRHARLVVGGDLHLLAESRHSVLKVAGNVYLPDQIKASLIDVRLHIEGGLFPQLDALSSTEVEPERQHVRVVTRLHAYLAEHGVPPVTFRSCTILDLSAGGARCQMHTARVTPLQGTLLQMKFTLPEQHDPVLVLGRVARSIAPDTIAVAFLQLSQRDHDRLTTFCLQLLLNRARSELARPDRRKPQQ